MTSHTCPACGCERLRCNEGSVDHAGKAIRNALVWSCPECGWLRREVAPMPRAAPLTAVPAVWMN